jgi:hypothetical protein
VTRSVIGNVGLWGLLLPLWKYRVERYTGSPLVNYSWRQPVPPSPKQRRASNKTVEPPGRAWQSVGWT